MQKHKRPRGLEPHPFASACQSAAEKAEIRLRLRFADARTPHQSEPSGLIVVGIIKPVMNEKGEPPNGRPKSGKHSAPEKIFDRMNRGRINDKSGRSHK